MRLDVVDEIQAPRCGGPGRGFGMLTRGKHWTPKCLRAGSGGLDSLAMLINISPILTAPTPNVWCSWQAAEIQQLTKSSDQQPTTPLEAVSEQFESWAAARQRSGSLGRIPLNRTPNRSTLLVGKRVKSTPLVGAALSNNWVLFEMVYDKYEWLKGKKWTREEVSGTAYYGGLTMRFDKRRVWRRALSSAIAFLILRRTGIGAG